MATELGKVAAAIYGEIAPTDTSFLWGKQLDAVGNPNLVSFFYHDGTDWLPLRGSDFYRDPVINQVATPPVSPTNGDRYLVASSGATGDFVGNENSIAVWNDGTTSWEYTTASAGNFLYNSTDQVNVLFNGTKWLTQNKFTGDNIEITGGGGAILKVVGGEFQLRNAADTAFSSLTVESFTVNGGGVLWNNNLTVTDANTIQNTAISNISAQTGVTTFDGLFQNIVNTGRTSTGEANHLKFQTNSVDVFKVNTSGFIKSGATFEHHVNGVKVLEIDESQNTNILGDIIIAGHLLPSINATYNLGSISKYHLFNYTGRYKATSPGSLANVSYGWANDGNTGMMSQAADSITFVSGGIEAIVIDNNQNINIPNGNLTISGNGLIIPVGLDADRVVQEGSFRLNSTGNNTEIYKTVGGWTDLEGGGFNLDTVNGLTDGNETEVKIIADSTQSNWVFNVESDLANINSRNNTVFRSTFNGTAQAALGGSIGYEVQEGVGTNTTIASTSYYRLQSTGAAGLWKTIANGTGTYTSTSRIQVTGSYSANVSEVLLEAGKMHVITTASTSTSNVEVGVIKNRALTGTVTVGFNPYTSIYLENSVGTDTNILRHGSKWRTIDTDGSMYWATTVGTNVLEITQGGNIGVFNATPIAQQAHIADATDAATAISQLNLFLAQWAAFGFQAAS